MFDGPLEVPPSLGLCRVDYVPVGTRRPRLPPGAQAFLPLPTDEQWRRGQGIEAAEGERGLVDEVGYYGQDLQGRADVEQPRPSRSIA